MSYTASELKLKVDKFVIVLVGSPRGVSTRTWVRNVPEQIRYTLDDRSTVTNKNRYNRERLGHHPDNRPELHICCVTGEYDSSDRYFEGEDHTIAGLDPTPFFPKIHGVDHVDDELFKRWQDAREVSDAMFRDITFGNDKHKLPTMRGKISIKKDKWEAYQRRVWDFADSVNFSYPDPYAEANSWQEDFKFKSHVLPQGIGKTPQAMNQFLHFCNAYYDNLELFNSLTENSVVLRIRWDIHLGATMWEIANALLRAAFYNRLNGEKSHVEHFEGFDVTPLALCQGLSFIRGFLTATDYWHAFDGTGAQKFGKYFKQWMLDDPDRRALHANITDWQKPITKHNPFKIPESTVMMFLQEQNYTIYDFNGKTAEENLLQSFKTLLTDQWRYEWYEWTPEMVERLRKYAT